METIKNGSNSFCVNISCCCAISEWVNNIKNCRNAIHCFGHIEWKRLTGSAFTRAGTQNFNHKTVKMSQKSGTIHKLWIRTVSLFRRVSDSQHLNGQKLFDNAQVIVLLYYDCVRKKNFLQPFTKWTPTFTTSNQMNSQ